MSWVCLLSRLIQLVGCHLDAQMIQDALGDLNLDDLDMIIIENVGNLVCPAEFEIGESMESNDFIC